MVIGAHVSQQSCRQFGAVLEPSLGDDFPDSGIESLHHTVGLRMARRAQAMLDAQAFAAHVKVMAPAGLFGLAGEAISELRAVVGQHLGDDHRRGLVNALQEVHSTGLALIVVQADVHPARGPVDGHKQVATLGLVGHLRQVLDVDVDEAWLVVLEGLCRLGSQVVSRIELSTQGSQIAGIVPHQATIERRTRHLGVDEFTRDDEQIIQWQQEHAAQCNNDSLFASRQGRAKLVGAVAQVGRRFTALPLANRGLGDVVAPSKFGDGLLRSLDLGTNQRRCAGLRVDAGQRKARLKFGSITPRMMLRARSSGQLRMGT